MPDLENLNETLQRVVNDYIQRHNELVTEPREVIWCHCDEYGNRADEVTGYFRIDQEVVMSLSTPYAEYIMNVSDSAGADVMDRLAELVRRERERMFPTHKAPLVDNDNEPYPEDMPGMTLNEFQAWSDQIIKDAQQ